MRKVVKTLHGFTEKVIAERKAELASGEGDVQEADEVKYLEGEDKLLKPQFKAGHLLPFSYLVFGGYLVFLWPHCFWRDPD
jgi:hypothetical protein